MEYNLFSFNNNPVSLLVADIQSAYRQWHARAEIVYVLQGTASITIRQHTYTLNQDDLILINPYEFHDVAYTNAKALIVKIDYSMYDKSALPVIPTLDCNSATIADKSILVPIKSTIAKIVKCSADGEKGNALRAKSLSYTLLSQLTENFTVPNIDDTATEKPSNIEEILQFCAVNHDHNFSLKDLASNFYFTVPYMSKLFKQVIGVNFLEYMTDIRLQHLHSDLFRGKLTNDQLAEKHGFASTRSMLTAFKAKYGVSLSYYRKNPPKSTLPSTTLTLGQHTADLQILTRYLNDESNSAPKRGPTQVIQLPAIDAHNVVTTFRHGHSYICNVSYAHELLYQYNQALVREAQKEIGFKYIGFHGLLDDELMVYGEDALGNPIYSFELINKVIDFVVELGLIPALELSFMPSQLVGKKYTTMFYKKSKIGLPKDMQKWCDLIKALFCNLVERYGEQFVSSCPVSLWSTPDSTVGEFGLGSMAVYNDFFLNTYRSVKSVVPNANFQSPNFRNVSAEQGTIVSNFLQFCKKNDCMPTAINVGFFPISPSFIPESNVQTSIMLPLLESQDAMVDSLRIIARNKSLMNWGDISIKLNQWNSSLSHRDLLHDTSFKSTYIVKNILQIDEYVNGTGYWTLIDNSETQLPTQQFHGGIGLFTKDGIKKPAYHAFVLLSKMGKEVLHMGNSCMVTKQDDKIQIMLYNYNHYNNLYANGELFDMSETNRYTMFSQKIDKKYVLSLNNLPSDNYKTTYYTVGPEEGSSFFEWLNLGAPQQMTAKDISYINSVSVPKVKIENTQTTNGICNISAILPPHTICLVELSPR